MRLFYPVCCVAALLLISCGGEKAEQTETTDTVLVSSTQRPRHPTSRTGQLTTSIPATTHIGFFLNEDYIEAL